MHHHRAGLARCLETLGTEADHIQLLLEEVESFGRAGAPLPTTLSGKDLALLHYALKLSATPAKMVRADAQALRNAGCDDGEILDANQVTAYFAYANRVVDGLGVELEGEIAPEIDGEAPAEK